MATKGEPSIAARLVQRFRKRRSLTAEQLADRIPDPTITKTVITNLEAGRKKDLSATELLQIASALQVPPMLLAIPSDDPFAEMPVPGLAEPYSSMCVAEYLCAAGIDYTANELSITTRRVMSAFDSIIEIERRIFDFETIENLDEESRRQFDDEGSVTMWFTRPDGSELVVSESSLSDDAWGDRLDKLDVFAQQMSRQLKFNLRGIRVPGWLVERANRSIDYVHSVYAELEQEDYLPPERLVFDASTGSVLLAGSVEL